MTLKEAIERSKIMVNMREKRGYPHELAALRLLIEAGEWMQRCRGELRGGKYPGPLPGETSE